jgi:hypothetical protein
MTLKFKRVGGLRFLRIGRLSLSWSIVRARPDLSDPYLLPISRSALAQ